MARWSSTAGCSPDWRPKPSPSQVILRPPGPPHLHPGQFGGPVLSLDRGTVTVLSCSGQQIASWRSASASVVMVVVLLVVVLVLVLLVVVLVLVLVLVVLVVLVLVTRSGSSGAMESC